MSPKANSARRLRFGLTISNQLSTWPTASLTKHIHAKARPPRLWNGAQQTIRRNALRLLVPLANTTIYEMEQRGEFPRRLNLTSRCVVWYLDEVEAWIEQRYKNSYAARVRLAPSPDVHMRRARPTSKSKRDER